MVLGEWPHNDRAVVMEGPVVLNGLYWYRLLPVAKSNATSVWSAWGTDPTVGPWFLTCADQPRFVSPNVTNVTTLTSASTTVTVINATITDTTNNATVADLTSEEGGQALLIGGIVAAVVLAILLLLLFLMIAGKFGRSSSERETFDVPNDHYEEPTHNGAPLPRATEVSVDVGGTTLVAAETIDEPMPESNRYNDLVLKPANNYVSAPKSQKTPRYSVGAMSTFVEPKK